MVNPVMSGVAQQIPAANTFQPGSQNDAVKRTGQDERQNAAQTGDVNAARTQNVDTRNSEKTSALASNRNEDTGRVSASSARGTTVDISV